MKVVGETRVDTSYQTQEVNSLSLAVVEGSGPSLLGRIGYITSHSTGAASRQCCSRRTSFVSSSKNTQIKCSLANSGQ